MPWCYYPANYGYSIDGQPFDTATGIAVYLVRNSNIGTMFGSDFNNLLVEAEYQTTSRLRIKIS